MLIQIRHLAYPWIRLIIGNGRNCNFWHSNWSPYGDIKEYLSTRCPLRFGISSDSSLAGLWRNDHWNLPMQDRKDKLMFTLTWQQLFYLQMRTLTSGGQMELRKIGSLLETLTVFWSHIFNMCNGTDMYGSQEAFLDIDSSLGLWF